MGEECKGGSPAPLVVRGEDDGEVDEAAAAEKLYEDVPPMPLMALNHISRLCKSVDASVRFYVRALGFVLIHRPPALDFSGAWYVHVESLKFCPARAFRPRWLVHALMTCWIFENRPGFSTTGSGSIWSSETTRGEPPTSAPPPASSTPWTTTSRSRQIT